MVDEPEPTVDAQRLADLLGVSKDTVYSKARSGEIPSIRVGRLWRFYPSEVHEHLRQRAAPRDPWEPNSHMRAAHLGWERRHARGR